MELHEIETQLFALRAQLAAQPTVGHHHIDELKSELATVREELTSLRAATKESAGLNRKLLLLEQRSLERESKSAEAILDIISTRMVADEKELRTDIEHKLLATAGAASDAAREARSLAAVQLEEAVAVLREGVFAWAVGESA